jgi:hypothetical protein
MKKLSIAMLAALTYFKTNAGTPPKKATVAAVLARGLVSSPDISTAVLTHEGLLQIGEVFETWYTKMELAYHPTKHELFIDYLYNGVCSLDDGRENDYSLSSEWHHGYICVPSDQADDFIAAVAEKGGKACGLKRDYLKAHKLAEFVVRESKEGFQVALWDERNYKYLRNTGSVTVTSSDLNYVLLGAPAYATLAVATSAVIY